MTRPEDLPDFGNIPGYVPNPDAPKIIVPPPVTKDSPIEAIETPDELEAGTVHGKDWTDEDDSLVPKAVTDRALSPGEREELITIREPGEVDYKATHPDYKMDIGFQIKMFHDMVHQAKVELRDIQKRMDNLEIKLDFYPETTGSDDINEMRSLFIRNIELQNEVHHYSQQIQIRVNAMNKADTEPAKKKGLWARIRNK